MFVLLLLSVGQYSFRLYMGVGVFRSAGRLYELHGLGK